MTTELDTQAETAADDQIASPDGEDNLPPLEATPVEGLHAQLYGGQQPEPPKEEKSEQTPPEEKTLPHRISTAQFSSTEQEAIALAKELRDAGEEVPPLIDRIKLVENRHATKAAEEAARVAKAAEPQPEPQPSRLESLEAQIADIDAKLKTAGEEGSVLTPELTDLITTRQDLLMKREKAADAETAAGERARQTVISSRAESIKAAKERYPDAADDKTLLGQRVAQRIAELKSPDHPDHSTLSAVNAPLIVAREVADEYAREMAQQNGSTYTAELAKLTGEPVIPAETGTRKIQPVSGAATIATQTEADPSKLLGDPAAYVPGDAQKFFSALRPKPAFRLST